MTVLALSVPPLHAVGEGWRQCSGGAETDACDAAGGDRACRKMALDVTQNVLQKQQIVVGMFCVACCFPVGSYLSLHLLDSPPQISSNSFIT